VNKPGKPVTRLAALGAEPGPGDLRNLMEFAKRKPGELAEISWPGEGCTYILRVHLPVARAGNLKAIKPTDIEWTFMTRKSPTAVPEIHWTHACADLEFISNLLIVQRDSPCAPNAGDPQVPERQIGRARISFSSLAGVPKEKPAPVPEPELSPAVGFPPGGMVLSGELTDVELIGILQSIALMRMSGSLEVNFRLNEALLFFEEGVLVHAVHQSTVAAKAAPSLTGDQVLLDLLLWDSGHFKFSPGMKAPKKSVERRLDALLIEGAALQDYWKGLVKAGMKLEKSVKRTRSDLRFEEFSARVAEGLPLDPELQRKLYLEINGKSSLQDIVSRLKLPRLRWVPLVFNLQNLGLVSFAGASAHGAESVSPPVPDYLTLNKVRNCLIRMETGLMTYELFYYFLQLEFERARIESSHIFSVIVFSILGLQEPLSVLSIIQLSERINRVKDELDMVAHYRESEFIMMCPCKDAGKAASLAKQAFESLKQRSLPGIKADGLKMAFGVAEVPVNSTQITRLLSQAEAARISAATAGRLIAISSEKDE
jgi:GGDEF domain-containing protein